MTDPHTEPGRIDFGMLTDDPEFASVDRVMARVHAQRQAGQPRSANGQALYTLEAYARPIAMAAAILIAVSLASMAVPVHAADPVTPQQALASWVSSKHVPTNGELLRTFEGYSR